MTVGPQQALTCTGVGPEDFTSESSAGQV